MNNQQIIDKRWKKTEKSFRKHLKEVRDVYREIGDDAIDLVNSMNVRYEDLNKAVPANIRRQTRRKIDEWRKEGIVTGYFGYLVLSLHEYTYAKVLEILIYGLYMSGIRKLNTISNKIFKESAQDCYEQGLEDLERKSDPLSWAMILPLLVVPSVNVTFEQYLTVLNETAADEMYRQMLECIRIQVEDLQEKVDGLLNKQANRVLNVNGDKETGAVADTARAAGNEAYTLAGGENDQLVLFVAEVDNRTTKMCLSLDQQIFHTKAWNRFERYSDYYKGNHTFSVFGLERGLNMPPITDHFHWCRSTLTYQNADTYDKIRKMQKWFSDIFDNINNATYEKLYDVIQRIDRIKAENGFEKDFKIDSYVERDGIKHYIDGKNVLFDPSDEEIYYAFRFQNEFGKDVTMRPRTSNINGVRSSDYFFGKDTYDLKCFSGANERTIRRKIKDSKGQSDNFIVKVKEGSRTPDQAANDIKIMKKHNEWIRKVYLFDKDDQLVGLFE